MGSATLQCSTQHSKPVHLRQCSKPSPAFARRRPLQPSPTPPSPALPPCYTGSRNAWPPHLPRQDLAAQEAGSAGRAGHVSPAPRRVDPPQRHPVLPPPELGLAGGRGGAGGGGARQKICFSHAALPPCASCPWADCWYGGSELLLFRRSGARAPGAPGQAGTGAAAGNVAQCEGLSEHAPCPETGWKRK